MRAEGPKVARRVRNAHRFAYLAPVVVDSPRGLKATDVVAMKLSKCYSNFADNTSNSGLIRTVAGQMDVKIKAGIAHFDLVGIKNLATIHFTLEKELGLLYHPFRRDR